MEPKVCNYSEVISYDTFFVQTTTTTDAAIQLAFEKKPIQMLQAPKVVTYFNSFMRFNGVCLTWFCFNLALKKVHNLNQLLLPTYYKQPIF